MRRTRPRGFRRLTVESLENRLALSGFALRDDFDDDRPLPMEPESRLADMKPGDFGPQNFGLQNFGLQNFGLRDFGPRDFVAAGFGTRDTGPRGAGFRDVGESSWGPTDGCCEASQGLGMLGLDLPRFESPRFESPEFEPQKSGSASYDIVVLSTFESETVWMDVYRPVVVESFSDPAPSFRATINDGFGGRDSLGFGGNGVRGRVDSAEGEFGSAPVMSNLVGETASNSPRLGSTGASFPNVSTPGLGSFSFATTAFAWWMSTRDARQADDLWEVDSTVGDSVSVAGSGWSSIRSTKEWAAIDSSVSADAILSSWGEDSEVSASSDALIDIQEVLGGDWSDSAEDRGTSQRGAAVSRGTHGVNLTADAVLRGKESVARRGLSPRAAQPGDAESRQTTMHHGQRPLRVDSGESSVGETESTAGMIELAHGRRGLASGGMVAPGRSLAHLIRIDASDARRQAFDLGTDRQLSPDERSAEGLTPEGPVSARRSATGSLTTGSLTTGSPANRDGESASAVGLDAGESQAGESQAVEGESGGYWSLLLGVAAGTVVISSTSNARWDALCGGAQRFVRSKWSRFQLWRSKLGF